MDKASEAITAGSGDLPLQERQRPIALQFGLIAEEVAKVNPDLVAVDKKENPTPFARKQSTQCCSMSF